MSYLVTCARLVPVCATNKTDLHDITEILMKVALNSHNPNGIRKGFIYL